MSPAHVAWLVVGILAAWALWDRFTPERRAHRAWVRQTGEDAERWERLRADDPREHARLMALSARPDAQARAEFDAAVERLRATY